ncbi:MAG TPA: ACP S-malonyltransferase [Burkholderiaceae bacterium]|nr:ACP S-malonyltransferase [Burkholderiaceae bacterium]
MKLAFVFPGQGSQTVGMLSSFEGNPQVDAALEQGSGALGIDMRRLISEGPAEELGLTVNTQPAMLLAGTAIYRAWRAAGGAEPHWVAGHSLGEYSALTAAGVFDLADALRLVRFRATAMQEAVPVGAGAMAAIMGLDEDGVAAACADAAAGEIVCPANFNAPSQVVISGHKAAVERACAAAKQRGAKRAVMLPVSAPFHSPLMQPAAQRLREALAKTRLAEPTIAVVNNVDVAIEREPARIADALARQAASPVRWVETIQTLASQGVTHVVECGPGRVLSGLTKRIVPTLESLAINDVASLEEALAAIAAAEGMAR